MNGRWNITKPVDANFSAWHRIDGPITDDVKVPVVPCDNAAVYRGARAICSEPEPCELCMSSSEAVLRAAGETS